LRRPARRNRGTAGKKEVGERLGLWGIREVTPSAARSSPSAQRSRALEKRWGLSFFWGLAQGALDLVCNGL
jgi:hypothetical protein